MAVTHNKWSDYQTWKVVAWSVVQNGTSRTTLEKWEAFLSPIRKMVKRNKPPTTKESWKFQRRRRCLAQTKKQKHFGPSRTDESKKFPKAKMHASWRLMSPRAAFGIVSTENSWRSDRKQRTQFDGSITIWCTHLFRYFKRWKFRKQKLQDKELDKLETIPSWQLDKVKSNRAEQ